MYCAQISDLISAVIIYLCGFVLFIKLTIRRFLAKQGEKAAKKAIPAAAKGGDR